MSCVSSKASIQPSLSAIYVPQNLRATSTNTSAHTWTLARSTHSTSACGPAPRRVGRKLGSALDQRGVQRSVTQQRMGRARLQLAVELLQRDEDATHVEDRVDPLGAPAAVGRAAVCRDRGPCEAFVRDTEL